MHGAVIMLACSLSLRLGVAGAPVHARAAGPLYVSVLVTCESRGGRRVGCVPVLEAEAVKAGARVLLASALCACMHHLQ